MGHHLSITGVVGCCGDVDIYMVAVMTLLLFAIG